MFLNSQIYGGYLDIYFNAKTTCWFINILWSNFNETFRSSKYYIIQELDEMEKDLGVSQEKMEGFLVHVRTKFGR